MAVTGDSPSKPGRIRLIRFSGLMDSGRSIGLRFVDVAAVEPGDLGRKLAELAVHLGQPGDHLEDPPLLADRDRGRAQHLLAAGNVAMDPAWAPTITLSPIWVLSLIPACPAMTT